MFSSGSQERFRYRSGSFGLNGLHGGHKTLKLPVRATCAALALLFLAGASLAMPALRKEDGSAQPIRATTLPETSLFGRPAGSDSVDPYEDLFKRPQEDVSLYRVGEDGGVIPLSPEDQREIRKILDAPDDPGFAGSSAEQGSGAGVDAPRSGPLMKDFVAEVDALYADLAASTDPNYVPSAGLGGQPGVPGFEQPGVLRVVRARNKDDLPLLSAIPLGTIFVESIKSLVESGAVDPASLSSLRDFILVQQPGSGSLMMVDSGSGYTLLLRPSDDPLLFKEENRGNNWFSATDGGDSRSRKKMPAPGEPRPLLLKIWDILTSLGAFVFYGIAAVCWAAWRYVISRYA